jgi:hypothetical protein
MKVPRIVKSKPIKIPDTPPNSTYDDKITQTIQTALDYPKTVSISTQTEEIKTFNYHHALVKIIK